MSERYCVVLFLLIVLMFHVSTLYLRCYLIILKWLGTLALQLSFDATGDLLGNWLFCMQIFPCLGHAWSRCGGL